MKYGKFVGTEYLNFTDTEVKLFKEYLSGIVSKYDTEMECSVEFCDKNLKHLTIRFSKKSTEYRNWFKSRVSFSGISFVIYKEKGYLDNWDWVGEKLWVASAPKKDFENAPTFQYSISILYKGYLIPYRHRAKQTLSTMGMFDYGTKIMDLDVEKPLKELYTEILIR